MSPTAGIDSRELVAIGLNRKISQIDFNREALPDALFENLLVYDVDQARLPPPPLPADR